MRTTLYAHSIFIKKSKTRFTIIVVYVDDLNLVGTIRELTRTTNYLKNEFEMKDIRIFFFVSTYRLSISLLGFWFTNGHVLRKY